VAALVLVAVAGWFAARRGVLGPEACRGIGRMVVDFTFPALTFVQMLRTVTPGSMQGGARLLLLAALSMGLCLGIGLALAGRRAGRDRRKAFAFLVGTPNWIFLPLPLAEALHGADGIRAVLLVNIVVQLFLWTVDVELLHGGLRGTGSLRVLATNSGLLGTLAGLLLAFGYPGAARWAAGEGAGGLLCSGLDMLGSLTVPLSVLLTGAQFAGLQSAGLAGRGQTSLLLAARLVLCPAAVALLLAAAGWAGVSLVDADRDVLLLIFAMPVAVSCGPFLEKFGGDAEFGARSIAYSTLAAVVSVPVVLTVLVQWLR